ncbi:hypothetical protein XENOCAPTIV_006941, partial [Xenoophorus captivus]
KKCNKKIDCINIIISALCCDGFLTFLICPTGSGVSAFCLHPGVIRTELGRHVEGWFPLLGALLRLPALLLMKTPREGSQTTVFCAVTPGLQELSGHYFR